MAVRHRRALALAFVFALTSLPVSAHADDAAVARERFEEAKAAFGAGRYAEAADAYEQSANAKPHPAPLVNAAEAWELDGNFVRAAQACDRALELASDAKLRDALEQRLARLRKRVGTVSFRGPSGSTVTIDKGQPVAVPARARLSPGRHELVYVEASGAQSTEALRIGAGEERLVVISGAPRSTAPTPPEGPAREEPSSSRGGPKTASWVSFGVGAVALGAASVLGVMTLSAKSAYEDSPSHDTLDDFHATRLATNVSLGVAGVAVVTGVVLWLLQPREAHSSASGGSFPWARPSMR